MRFTRYPLRAAPIQWTKRKLSRAAAAVRREQDSVALFPELSKYKTVQDRVTEIEADHSSFIRTHRAFQARSWREARRIYFSLPPVTRAGMRALWSRGIFPADPVYLLGRLRCQESPWTTLRRLRQFVLAGQGKLPRTIFAGQ